MQTTFSSNFELTPHFHTVPPQTLLDAQLSKALDRHSFVCGGNSFGRSDFFTQLTPLVAIAFLRRRLTFSLVRHSVVHA